MPIYVYPDRIEFPNYSLRITSNGVGVTSPSTPKISGTFTNVGSIGAVVAQGSVSGYTSGGTLAGGQTNTIDKFPFATNANATDVGDLTQGRYTNAGQSSSSYGYTSSGRVLTPPPALNVNVIDRFPFATNANASDVGDVTQSREAPVGQSSTSNGYTSGGVGSNTIDNFPFATNTNASDVGDLSITRYLSAGQSSSTNGYTSGGFTPIYNVIDKFPFATNTNASDVGDLTQARFGGVGQSSTINGYTSGGAIPPGPTAVNTIDVFPFATNANATDVGDLTQPRDSGAGQSSYGYGYTSGGNTPGGLRNNIDRFTFAYTANASDVGDLTVARASAAGQQY